MFSFLFCFCFYIVLLFVYFYTETSPLPQWPLKIYRREPLTEQLKREGVTEHALQRFTLTSLIPLRIRL